MAGLAPDGLSTISLVPNDVMVALFAMLKAVALCEMMEVPIRKVAVAPLAFNPVPLPSTTELLTITRVVAPPTGVKEVMPAKVFPDVSLFVIEAVMTPVLPVPSILMPSTLLFDFTPLIVAVMFVAPVGLMMMPPPVGPVPFSDMMVSET